ncbi:hypothetical protein [Iningainema tapete]|uniref:hypothetical protein n=1 Tax=Iningainema tapete TaxID=2806730 RepID=UPI001EE23022|nr:hypothetical protein [Iningainema tapete]
MSKILVNFSLQTTACLDSKFFAPMHPCLLSFMGAPEFQGLTLDNHPNLKRWVEKVQQRPAVQRGMNVP